MMTCQGCSVGFTPKSTRQRYCSKSCASKATAANRNGSSNANWRGGKTKHPLYDTYLDMVARCTRTTHHAWQRYGGRGITVCDPWKADFWAFVADMGDRPAGLTVERVNNDGPYSPENCVWGTVSQQNRNRRPEAYAGLTRDTTTGRWRTKAA